MVPGNQRLLTAATCALALVAGWLLVAGLIDAQHPASVVAYVDTKNGAGGSVSWWSIAAGISWRAVVALVLAVAAAWLRSASHPPSAPVRVALLLCAVTATALAGVGAGGVLGMLSDHGPVAEPSTLVAVAGFDVVVGILLTSLIFSQLYAAAPVTSNRSTNQRFVPLPLATIVVVLIAAGVVLGLAETAGGLSPRVEGATVTSIQLTGLPPQISEAAPPDESSSGDFQLVPSSALATAIAAELPGGVVRQADGCQDESANVAGTHAPRGCAPLAAVEFRPARGALGQAFVDDYVDDGELRYQCDVELRYMRQYAGLRLDRDVPGVVNAQMFHTGAAGDLFAVVAQTGSRLVIEFVSSGNSRTLTPAQIAAATRQAHLLLDTVRAS